MKVEIHQPLLHEIKCEKDSERGGGRERPVTNVVVKEEAVDDPLFILPDEADTELEQQEEEEEPEPPDR
jgi:hypothetical protein